MKSCDMCGKEIFNNNGKYCCSKCYHGYVSKFIHSPTLMNRGYIYIYKPEHPQSTKKGYIFEHKLIGEAKIGRFLEKGEVAHHINGVKTDNRPENILVMTKKEHSYLHRYKFIAEHNRECSIKGCKTMISSKGGICRKHYCEIYKLNRKVKK
jgi:hypothetical protein